MTDIRFTDLAKSDLRQIRTFYDDISPRTTRRVMDDITSTLKVLEWSPEAGFEVRPGKRRLATVKYQYVIEYKIVDQAVLILGIYRHQNRS